MKKILLNEKSKEEIYHEKIYMHRLEINKYRKLVDF